MLVNPAPAYIIKSLKTAILYLLMLCSSILIGKNSLAQTKYLADNFWIENYSKKDGLPEGIVIDIMQDRKGYMWMTTPYNLVRFDGYEFKTFSPRKDFPNLYIHFFSGLN